MIEWEEWQHENIQNKQEDNAILVGATPETRPFNRTGLEVPDYEACRL